MRLGSRRFERRGEKSRRRQLLEENERLTCGSGCREGHGRIEHREMDRRDRPKLRHVLSGRRAALAALRRRAPPADHAFAGLGMKDVRHAAAHRARCGFASDARAQHCEGCGKQRDDREYGARKPHTRMLAQGVGRAHAVCPQFGGSVACDRGFRGSELQLRHKAYI